MTTFSQIVDDILELAQDCKFMLGTMAVDKIEWLSEDNKLLIFSSNEIEELIEISQDNSDDKYVLMTYQTIYIPKGITKKQLFSEFEISPASAIDWFLQNLD